MKTYRSGERINPGIYWSLASGEFFQSSAPDTMLPGSGNQRYIRLPGPLVLLMGPLFGLGYVIFLPLVGIVGLGVFLMRQLAHLVQGPVQEAAAVVVPSWVPGVSYLVRGRRAKGQRPPKAAKPVSGAADSLVEELEQELRERRSRGEK